ncbi:uncharacterized protein LOC112049434 isoform X2 [Bicyclus anynana]|uniref:Uncharacterized protein LOC112049434 isoform X2 n=1 Tax=Bicyclus anynana TaxID=110368 RepID=A0A6J1NIX7_BICAN|nr:uncharacterized protein LOC112049434 isoform X2 [Bicyclus anynana]XP_052738543.1 uncharacterized protein LOC112049434 isoform X2 [Bicyclus anynana]
MLSEEPLPINTATLRRVPEMKLQKSGRNSDQVKSKADQPDQASMKRGKKRKRQADFDEIKNENGDFQINPELYSDSGEPTNFKRYKLNEFNSQNEESLCEAEDYLNLRVKQEEAAFLEPTPVKLKKKKKCKVEPETIENQEIELSTIDKKETDIKERNIDSSSLVNSESAESSEKEVGYKKKKKPHRDPGELSSFKRHKLNDSSFKRHKLNDSSLSSQNEESMCEAEDYLNLKVKQEQAAFVESTPVNLKKKKKYKVKPEIIENQEIELSTIDKNEIDIEEHNIDSSSLGNGESTESNEKDVSYKKKKKKKKGILERENRDISEILENSEVYHTLTIEKTINNDDFNHDIKNNSQIMSSTLLNNFTYDNGKQDCNKDLQKVNASTLNSAKSSNNASTLSSAKSSNHITVANEKKTCRISDRIRFEDDSVDYDMEEYAPKNDLSDIFKQFSNSNINLTQLQVNLKSDPGLGEDDEIWIIRGPHEIYVEDFINTNLSLDNKRKLKINGKTYESIIDTNTFAIPILLFNEHKVFIKNIPLMGIINLHKRIPKVHIPYESLVTNDVNTFTLLPDTKCRHPLFGINYKKATKIPVEIAERLSMSDAQVNTENKKKKKQEIKTKHEIDSDTEIKPNIEILNCSKKKKVNSNAEIHFNKNKFKKENQATEANVEDVPDNVVAHSIKKKKKIKQRNDDTSLELKLNIEPLQSKKKKKYEETEQKYEIQSDFEVQLNTDRESNKKRRKNSDERGSKKVKRDTGGADAWDSEKAIEKNLFDF